MYAQLRAGSSVTSWRLATLGGWLSCLTKTMTIRCDSSVKRAPYPDPVSVSR